MDVHADVLFLTHKRSLSRGWRSEQSQPLAKVGAFSYCLQWVVTSPTLGSACKQSARGAEAAITGLSGCVPEAAATVHVADQSYRGVGEMDGNFAVERVVIIENASFTDHGLPTQLKFQLILRVGKRLITASTRCLVTCEQLMK
jgi:hypothetical protein